MASRRRAPVEAAHGGILLAVALIVPLASCSQVGEQQASTATATVAVLVPSAEEDDLTSAGVVAAVEAAVGSSTADLNDWDVSVETVVAGDHDADTAAALQALLDEDLIAVIGGLDTSTVRTAQPILDARDVIFVSPADVRPEHTRGADPTTPLRPYASYFRTAVADLDPVAEAMRYAAANRGVADVTVLDTEGGTEPVRGADAAQAAGLEVVVPDGGDDEAETVPLTGPVSGSADLEARVAAAAGTGADGIYLATAASRVPQILERLAAEGSQATVFGGKAFAGDAPPAVGEFTGTVLRAREAKLPTTMNATPDEIDVALDGAAPGQYGAAAFDAGKVVGAVLTSCLPSAAAASDARTGCLGEISHTRVAGVTGEVAFDEFGDRIGGTVTVEIADTGVWADLSGR